jgi:hypothetical protein
MGKEGMKDKPTFIRAAIMDWKYQRISSGRLFEILRVPYRLAYIKLLDEQKKTDKWFNIPAARIEELIMTTELLTIKAKQDLGACP